MYNIKDLHLKYFPGKDYIFNDKMKSFDSGIFLMTGPKMSGKSIYCNNLFINAINEGSFCIYISSSLTGKQYNNLFLSKNKNLEKDSKLINPYLMQPVTQSDNLKDEKLYLSYLKIKELIDAHANQSTCLIMNSLTNLLTCF